MHPFLQKDKPPPCFALHLGHKMPQATVIRDQYPFFSMLSKHLMGFDRFQTYVPFPRSYVPADGGQNLQLSIVAAIVLRLILIVLILILVILIVVLILVVLVLILVLIVLILIVHCFISSLQMCIRKTDLQDQYVQKEMILYTFLKRISVKKLFRQQIEVRAKQ